MIANINPTDYLETLSTLRYANRVKYVQNKIRVNESSYTVPSNDVTVTTLISPLPPPLPLIVKNGENSSTFDDLQKRNLLLEKMIAVCIPDKALVHKLESSAVWNDEVGEWSIPVHYVSHQLCKVVQIINSGYAVLVLFFRPQRSYLMLIKLMLLMFVAQTVFAMKIQTGL